MFSTEYQNRTKWYVNILKDNIVCKHNFNYKYKDK